MSGNWKDNIYHQRANLAAMLHEPLASLAQQCSVTGERGGLNGLLIEGFNDVPHCTYLYVLNSKGLQISDNVSREGLVPGHYGRDRSHRPYMKEVVPSWGFLLSDAYISQVSRRPSLTALHVIRFHEQIVGYLGADFDLRNLPVTVTPYEEPRNWRQIKGDPSIRGTVFMQSRIESPMDKNIGKAFSILEELLMERGMFQGVIHFSSSRATVWFIDDPCRYRILDQEALEDPDICLAYPSQSYPADAVMPQCDIGSVLDGLRKLRMADETIYLRSASINIFNGMISLTFSCDGTHYMHYDEFLHKNMSFWLGSAA